MPPKHRKGNQGTRASAIVPQQTGPEIPPDAAVDPPHESIDSMEPQVTATSCGSPQGKGPRMVLTSDKRRGIYHCDYCHADISQEPRIRCAQCPDFDLCLNCFATTDHSAAIARLKAAATAHDAIAGLNGSIHGSGISSAAANHDDTHGYRVADSTRYPLFPPSRTVVPSRPSSTIEDKSEEGNVDKAMIEEPPASDANPTGRDAPVVDDKPETSAAVDSASAEEHPAPSDADQAMDIDNQDDQEEEDKTPDEETTEADTESVLVLQNDPKYVWTAEEDLRLLEAIKTHGLGNWNEISEAIGGPGSVGKTAKRCMERYIDDFLGRYGHILPAYTIAEADGQPEDDVVDTTNAASDETLRATKRPPAERGLLHSSSSVSMISTVGRTRKKARVDPTAALPHFEDVWPEPYLPPVFGVQMSQDVGREQSVRAEQAFVKAISQASTRDAVAKIHKEWQDNRLNKPGGPTVLPPRPEDLPALPGSELAGYMPRRGDMDLEWDNEAETILADMEFSSGDLPQDRQLKIQIIEIYNAKLDEREHRKKFLLSRNLLNYRERQQNDLKMPRDERDLVRRLRLFERLHTPEEHKQFVADILKAKRLRKEIAKLQMYRRMGITSLEEAEKFELDKSRREHHKMSHQQKQETSADKADQEGLGEKSSELWKQYKSNDRTARRSISRSDNGLPVPASTDHESLTTNAEPPVSDETGSAECTPAVPEATGNTVGSSDAAHAPPFASITESQAESQAPIDNDDDIAIIESPGFELLSTKEAALCRRLSLFPKQYMDVKAAILYESINQGLLGKEGASSNNSVVVKIDSKKKGDVVEFMVRSGWIPPQLSTTS